MKNPLLRKTLVFLFIFGLNLGLMYLIKDPAVSNLSDRDFVDALVLAAFNTVNIVFLIPFLVKKYPA
jgi:hypothetical protein